MEKTLYDLLNKTCAPFSAEVSPEEAETFSAYMKLLISWNEKMNLTAITDPEEIIIKHFADSLSISKYIKEYKIKSLADVGTGAGFPGIPLKICNPDLKICLCDSLAKRLTFLETVCRECGLSGVDIVHSRAEDLGRNPKYRDSFDGVTARAVAPMPVLAEYCLPLVKKGGHFIAMKGNPQNEPPFDNALSLLCGKLSSEDDFLLDFKGEPQHRHIYIINKTEKTPGRFPRKAGTASKNPL